MPYNVEINESYKPGATMGMMEELLKLPIQPETKYIIVIGSNDIKRTEYDEMTNTLDKTLIKLKKKNKYTLSYYHCG